MVAACSRTRGVDPRSAGRGRNLSPSCPEGPPPATHLCPVAAGRCAVAASSISPTACYPRGWTRSAGRPVATVAPCLRPRHKSGEFRGAEGLLSIFDLNPFRITNAIFIYSLLTKRSVTGTTWRRMVGCIVNVELERMWREVVVAQFEVLSGIFLQVLRKISLSVTGLWANIWTRIFRIRSRSATHSAETVQTNFVVQKLGVTILSAFIWNIFMWYLIKQEWK